MAGFAEGARVFGVDEVLDLDGAIEGEGGAVACDASGHDAIKHIHAA